MKHAGDADRHDGLVLPPGGTGSVHLQHKVLDDFKLARHRRRGDDTVELVINYDACLELGLRC